MNKIEKLIGLAVLSVLVVASPYLLAKYKAVNYANGQVILPGTSQQPTKADDSISTVVSPDGKGTLTMKKTPSKDSTTYTFTTDAGLNFTKTVSGSAIMSMPLNAWSPDDKYVFVKEDDNGILNYYLLSASGKTFSDGSIFQNISDVFAKKMPDFKLTEATGWADPVLIVMNTNTLDGKVGPSFWFEITDQAIIRLSERFN